METCCAYPVGRMVACCAQLTSKTHRCSSARLARWTAVAAKPHAAFSIVRKFHKTGSFNTAACGPRTPQ
eukprot:6607257-Pyramimonas_sp.AAC.1